MNDSKKQFVEQLLAADRRSPELQKRYEKEIHAMLEKSIGPRQRGLCLVAAVVLGLLGVCWSLTGLGMLAMCAFSAHEAAGRNDTPLEPLRATLVLAFPLLATGLALLVVTGMLFRAYWKGGFNQRSYRGWAAGAAVTYAGLLGALSLLLCPYLPDMAKDSVQVCALVLLLYAAVAWVRHRITQAEMRTAEKLLEIELRLLEIGANTKAGSPTDTSSPQHPSSA